jgi:hypothetical protein
MPDVGEVVVAANGGVFIAPTGSTMPTDATSALDAAFGELGYISEDGVNFGMEQSRDPLNAWQSASPIRYLQSSREFMASFELMQWNEDTLLLAFNGGQFTDNLDGTWDFDLPLPEEDAEFAMVIEAIDGVYKSRFVFERVTMTELGEIPLQRGDSANFPVTVKVLTQANGRPGAIFTDTDTGTP